MSFSAARPLRIGTRGSPLALAQAEELKQRFATAHPELRATGAVEIAVIKTTGDRVQDRRLMEIGGKGLFTKEIDEALNDRRVDCAVHSAKDMETWLPDGLIIGAFLPREDPRDALFARAAAGLDSLPTGAVVGTASLRRQAQILAQRPDLRIVTLRGNVETRLGKLEAGLVDATILALAGLKRLGLAARATAVLATEAMLPAAGQGAIAIEIRDDDAAMRRIVAPINDAATNACVAAERACLAELDGSCHTPIAALAELDDHGATIRLRALIALPDGRALHRHELRGPVESATIIGQAVGRVLKDLGGPEFFQPMNA